MAVALLRPSLLSTPRVAITVNQQGCSKLTPSCSRFSGTQFSRQNSRDTTCEDCPHDWPAALFGIGRCGPAPEAGDHAHVLISFSRCPRLPRLFGPIAHSREMTMRLALRREASGHQAFGSGRGSRSATGVVIVVFGLGRARCLALFGVQQYPAFYSCARHAQKKLVFPQR